MDEPTVMQSENVFRSTKKTKEKKRGIPTNTPCGGQLRNKKRNIEIAETLDKITEAKPKLGHGLWRPL